MAATESPLDPLSIWQPALSPQQLWAQLRPDWLTGYGDRDSQINQQWIANVNHRREQLKQYLSDHAQRQVSHPGTGSGEATSDRAMTTSAEKRWVLLIAEPDPLDFLASFWAALLEDWDIALANSNWGDREQKSAHQILHPTLIWPASASLSASAPYGRTAGRSPLASPVFPAKFPPASRPPAKILIPTSGTTGTLKFAHHTWATLYAAATGFCHAVASPSGRTAVRPYPIHTYCVLPVYHVSGLMQILRAWLSHAQVIITPFKTLETSPPLIHNPANWYISLVPTQLTRLIAANKGPWLKQFQAVLLGGAPPWATLLTQAAAQNIPLRLSYGMTETAAMVAVQNANECAKSTPKNAQSPSSGTPLPHVNISIEIAGQPQPANTLGQIVIHSPAVAHGYHGTNSAAFSAQTFYSDDLGYLTAQGQLHITGRASSKIISGGENIFPAEVEAALLSTGQVKDVHVFAQPDPQWGEVVIAAFVPARREVTPHSLKASLSAGSATPLLSHYKHPKRWIALSSIPRNAQGKLLKSALMTQILQLSNSSNSPAANSDASGLS